MRFSRRFRACAPLRSRSQGRSTAPTISSRTRCCARSPTSHRFERGHEPQRLAVHDPAQPLPLGVPQAPARGRGPGRVLCGAPDGPARAGLPARFRGFPRRARTSARRPARGAAARRRLGLLLRGGGANLRLRRRHHQEPRQPRALAPRRSCSRSRTSRISGRTA